MGRPEDRARDEAIAWHLRLDDAGETEWDAFLAWLERDPVHRLEFDRAERAGADLREAMPCFVGTDTRLGKPGRPRFGRRWPLIAGLTSVAASLVLALSFSFQASQPAAWTAVQTSPGEQRTVALSDGSRLYLNGGTRVLLDKSNYRLARVAQGEATFEVKHHATNPFTVEVGQAQLRDAGTIFNVRFDRGQSRIGIAEGAVLYNPGRENVTLTRGAVLTVSAGKGPAILSSVDPRGIGSWRQGQLVYDREAFDTVAADVGRILGTEVTVAPEIVGQRFTGVIRIDRNQAAFFPRLAGLLGVKVRRSQAGWFLGPNDRAHNSDPRSPGRDRS